MTPIPLSNWRDRLLTKYRRSGWRGFTRLHNFLKPSPARREIVVSTIYGSRFLLNPYDIVDAHVIAEGFYESEVIEALRPELESPGAVLWVVGANFGLHAVTAKWLYPTTRVLAFEPHPLMTARLMDNCSLNHVSVELHAYALSDHEGVLEFHANNSGNPGMSTLHPVAGSAYEQQFHVGVFSAQTLLSSGKAPAPTALLVDAEGAETDIMTGFGESLSSPTLRCIVFEASNELLESPAPDKLRELLLQAGFTIERLERREDTAHSLSNFVARRPTLKSTASPLVSDVVS